MSIVRTLQASAAVLLCFGTAQANSVAPAATVTPINIGEMTRLDGNLRGEQPEATKQPKADATKLPKAEATKPTKPGESATKAKALLGGRGDKKKKFGASRKERDEQRVE